MPKVILYNNENYKVSAGESAEIIGNSTAQTITVEAGASVSFFGGMAGDTVVLAGNAANYTAVANGVTVTLTDTVSGAVITIPATTAAASLQFDDGARDLVIDTSGEAPAVTLGGDVLSGTEAPLPGDPSEPSETTLSLTEMLATLQSAQQAKADFLSGNADNETLEEQIDALGLADDETPTNAQVETAIADADEAADDAVDAAETALQTAQDNLDLARVEKASAPTPLNDSVDLTKAIADLDTLSDSTLLRDATLEEAATEAQANVDEATAVYNVAGAAVVGNDSATEFDLYGEANTDQYVDLSAVDAADMGSVTINLAVFGDEGEPNENNKDLNGGGGNDTIILPDLTKYTGTLTINNMILGSKASKGYDTLVAPGLADAVNNVAVAADTQSSSKEYLDFTLTTTGGGSVVFSSLIKADTLVDRLIAEGELVINEAGDGLEDADGQALTSTGVTVSGGEVTAVDASGLGTFLSVAFEPADFVQLLQGYGNLKDSASTAGLEQASFTAAELQDAIAAAEQEVTDFVASNGSNEEILADVRDAISAYAQAGGSLTAGEVSIDGNATLAALADAINGALKPVDESYTADARETAINDLVEAFGAAGADATLLGAEETKDDLNANELALENALETVVERTELDGDVKAAKDAFGLTDTGSVFNAIVALQEARQDLKDAVTTAEQNLSDAQSEADATQALVDELAGLTSDIEEAETALADDGYVVEALDEAEESGSAEQDIFLFAETDTAIAIDGFELTETDAEGNVTAGDSIFLGEQLSVVVAGEDQDISDSLGAVDARDVIVVDNGTDTTLYVEDAGATFAGNGSGAADMTEITLTGVTGAEVSVNADGFLTVA